jgi:hypothetical protein
LLLLDSLLLLLLLLLLLMGQEGLGRRGRVVEACSIICCEEEGGRVATAAKPLPLTMKAATAAVVVELSWLMGEDLGLE